GLRAAAPSLPRPQPRRNRVGPRHRVDFLPWSHARAHGRRRPRAGLAKLVSLFSLGGLARGPAQALEARDPAAARQVGRRGARSRVEARTAPAARPKLRRKGFERRTRGAALRAAVRGATGPGSRTTAPSHRRSASRRGDAL